MSRSACNSFSMSVTTCRLCPSFAGPRVCGPNLRYTRVNVQSLQRPIQRPHSSRTLLATLVRMPSAEPAKFRDAFASQDCTSPFFHRSFASELPNSHPSRLLLSSNLHLLHTSLARCPLPRTERCSVCGRRTHSLDYLIGNLGSYCSGRECCAPHEFGMGEELWGLQETQRNRF